MWKEGRELKRKTTAVAAGGLLVFYIGMIMYVFFSLLHIDTLVNYVSAMVFELIDFLVLGYLIVSNILSKHMKTGYFVPLIMVTVIYTLILDVINIAYVSTVSQSIFILINIVLLFIYSLISLPMYLMGKR